MQNRKPVEQPNLEVLRDKGNTYNLALIYSSGMNCLLGEKIHLAFAEIESDGIEKGMRKEASEIKINNSGYYIPRLFYLILKRTLIFRVLGLIYLQLGIPPTSSSLCHYNLLKER